MIDHDDSGQRKGGSGDPLLVVKFFQKIQQNCGVPTCFGTPPHQAPTCFFLPTPCAMGWLPTAGTPRSVLCRPAKFTSLKRKRFCRFTFFCTFFLKMGPFFNNFKVVQCVSMHFSHKFGETIGGGGTKFQCRLLGVGPTMASPTSQRFS